LRTMLGSSCGKLRNSWGGCKDNLTCMQMSAPARFNNRGESSVAARNESVPSLQQLALRAAELADFTIPSDVRFGAERSNLGRANVTIPEILVDPESGVEDPLTFRSRAMITRYNLRKRQRDDAGPREWNHTTMIGNTMHYGRGGEMRMARAERDVVHWRGISRNEKYARAGYFAVGPIKYLTPDDTSGQPAFLLNKGEVHPMFYRE